MNAHHTLMLLIYKREMWLWLIAHDNFKQEDN